MKNFNLLIALFFLVSFHSYSQKTEKKEQKEDFWKHVQFGGGVDLALGNNVTNIGLSPSAIYNFSNKFSAGLSLSYSYNSNKYYNTSANIYGGSILALFNPFRGAQLSAEFEELSVNYSGSRTNSNYSVPGLLFGAAFSIGRNVSIGMQYDVLYDENKSPYGSAFTPLLRLYF